MFSRSVRIFFLQRKGGQSRTARLARAQWQSRARGNPPAPGRFDTFSCFSDVGSPDIVANWSSMHRWRFPRSVRFTSRSCQITYTLSELSHLPGLPTDRAPALDTHA